MEHEEEKTKIRGAVAARNPKKKKKMKKAFPGAPKKGGRIERGPGRKKKGSATRKKKKAP